MSLGVTLLAVGLAGAAGALARYGVNELVAASSYVGSFPLATLTVNVTGALLVGLLYGYLSEEFFTGSPVKTVAATGFLGAYTTFSAFTVESVRLGEQGEYLLAAANIFGSMALGVGAVVAGLLLAKTLF